MAGTVTNDMKAARDELRSELGGDFDNSDDVIAARNAQLSRATAAAGYKPVDEDLTAKLDMGKIKVPRGHTVVAAKVRGTKEKWVLYVVDDGAGRRYKDSVEYTDKLAKNEKKRK